MKSRSEQLYASIIKNTFEWLNTDFLMLSMIVFWWWWDTNHGTLVSEATRSANCATTIDLWLTFFGKPSSSPKGQFVEMRIGQLSPKAAKGRVKKVSEMKDFNPFEFVEFISRLHDRPRFSEFGMKRFRRNLQKKIGWKILRSCHSLTPDESSL